MRNEKFKARSDWNFVVQLRNTAYIPQDNEYAYMRNYARWAKEIDGNEVRWHDPELFVADLQKYGYLRVDGDRYILHTLQPAVSDAPSANICKFGEQLMAAL